MCLSCRHKPARTTRNASNGCAYLHTRSNRMTAKKKDDGYLLFLRIASQMYSNPIWTNLKIKKGKNADMSKRAEDSQMLAHTAQIMMLNFWDAYYISIQSDNKCAEGGRSNHERSGTHANTDDAFACIIQSQCDVHAEIERQSKMRSVFRQKC